MLVIDIDMHPFPLFDYFPFCFFVSLSFSTLLWTFKLDFPFSLILAYRLSFSSKHPRLQKITNKHLHYFALLGNNESHGMRKEPELHLDIDLERNAHRYIGLSTPPRHLTIEDAFKNADMQRWIRFSD